MKKFQLKNSSLTLSLSLSNRVNLIIVKKSKQASLFKIFREEKKQTVPEQRKSV